MKFEENLPSQHWMNSIFNSIQSIELNTADLKQFQMKF